jgi:hypothetical protein
MALAACSSLAPSAAATASATCCPAGIRRRDRLSGGIGGAGSFLSVDRDITGVLTATGGMARRLLQDGLSGDLLVYHGGGLAPVT